jgi:hypothetical protein
VAVPIRDILVQAASETLNFPRVLVVSTIDAIQLYVNGSTDVTAGIPFTVSKAEDGPEGRPYPFSGAFASVIPGVQVVSGNNVFQFSAQDKVYAMPGFHTWAAHVVVADDPPPVLLQLPTTFRASTVTYTDVDDFLAGTGWGESLVSAVGFDATNAYSAGLHIQLSNLPLDPAQADQVTVDFDDGAIVLASVQLTETGPQTGVFVGTANQGPVRLMLGGVASLTSTSVNRLSAAYIVQGLKSPRPAVGCRQ